MTFLVYPGATRRRFEHSIGVMELAGRVFDVITRERNRHSSIDLFPDSKTLVAWRTIVRLAAFLHDLEVLRSEEMRHVLKTMMPPPELPAVIPSSPLRRRGLMSKLRSFPADEPVVRAATDAFPARK